MLYVMGVQATQIYDTFTFQAAGDKDKHDVVLAKFDQHFIPKVNTIHERAIFHSRLQQQGETIETYVRALHKIAKNCDFRNHHDDAIRDQLVIGIRDKGLSERLQLTQDLDLAKAVDKCRTSELVKKQMSEQTTTANLDAVRSQPNKQRRFNNGKPKPHKQNQPRTQPVTGDACKNCGHVHQIPNKCPAQGVACRYCHKKGHFARCCCKKKQRKDVHEVQEPAQEDY